MGESRKSDPVVCLGEALVDLTCTQPVESLAEAHEFEPFLGGSLANVAAVAARFGAPTTFTGGAGDDDWGRWLRDRLAEQGVGIEHFVLAPGTTSLAFVAVSTGGEPSFAFYEATERPAARAGAGIEAALAGRPGVLVLGSDTLLSSAERDVTLGAADLARERGWTVLVDPNLRPARWPEPAAMFEAVEEILARADVVKCNGAEAGELTGRDVDQGAMRALLDRGPSAVILTRGDRGALVASVGEGSVDVAVVDAEVEVVDATGAGDCVTGVLAAALAGGASQRDLERVVALAMDAAAGVVGQWGSLAGLPPAGDAEATLASALERSASAAG